MAGITSAGTLVGRTQNEDGTSLLSFLAKALGRRPSAAARRAADTAGSHRGYISADGPGDIGRVLQ